MLSPFLSFLASIPQPVLIGLSVSIVLTCIAVVHGRVKG